LVLFLLATKIILREYPPESTAVHKFTIPKKRMLTPKIEQIETRSHLKNRILVQVQGGAEVQPAGILQVFRGVEKRTQHRNWTKRLL
jgi:hypothetical protein